MVDVKHVYGITIVEEKVKSGMCNVASTDSILFLGFHITVFFV